MTKFKYLPPRSEVIAFHVESLLASTIPIKSNLDVNESDKSNRLEFDDDNSMWD